MKKLGMVNAVDGLLKSEIKKAERKAGKGFKGIGSYTKGVVNENGLTQTFEVQLENTDTQEVTTVTVQVWLVDRRRSYAL